jgi:hypothetical protein
MLGNKLTLQFDQKNINMTLSDLKKQETIVLYKELITD